MRGRSRCNNRRNSSGISHRTNGDSPHNTHSTHHSSHRTSGDSPHSPHNTHHNSHRTSGDGPAVPTIRTTAVMEPAPAATEPMESTLTMEPAGTSRMATATCWTEQAETCLEAPGGFLWRDRPRVALVRDRHLLCPATCLSHLRERYASPAGPAAHPCCALHGDRRRVYHCRPRHASHIFALKVLCEDVRNPVQRFQFFQEISTTRSNG